MEPERRRAGRSPARLTAIFKNLETGRVLRALTWNLSLVGMRLTTEGVLAPGTRLEVDLKLPDRKTPIICQAEVIWSQSSDEPHRSFEVPPAETGIKFLDLTPQDYVALKHYIPSYEL